MGLRATAEEDGVWMVDSVTGWAFGPQFDDADAMDEFIAYCARIEEVPKLRGLNDRMLKHLHERWLAWHAAAEKYMSDPEALEELRGELEAAELVEKLQAMVDVVSGRRAANEVRP